MKNQIQLAMAIFLALIVLGLTNSCGQDSKDNSKSSQNQVQQPTAQPAAPVTTAAPAQPIIVQVPQQQQPISQQPVSQPQTIVPSTPTPNPVEIPMNQQQPNQVIDQSYAEMNPYLNQNPFVSQFGGLQGGGMYPNNTQINQSYGMLQQPNILSPQMRLPFVNPLVQSYMVLERHRHKCHTQRVGFDPRDQRVYSPNWQDKVKMQMVGNLNHMRMQPNYRDNDPDFRQIDQHLNQNRLREAADVHDRMLKRY